MEKINKFQPLENSALWPGDLSEKIYLGFPDDKLEMICDWGLRGYDNELPYMRGELPKWIYWPVELYSFGRCYRDWLGLPSWAPLPLYGDHGVELSGEFDPHEAQSKPSIHLTWFGDRASSLGREKNKTVIRVPHPWITFRRNYGIKKLEDRKGTLIFFAHTNTDTEIFDFDLDKYFSELKSLPSEYHPLVLCMHRHDVEKKYHLGIREYGIPIISAGETSSPYFVERFYNMISHFKHATSNSGGSELFYCEEFGVKYFIMGEKPNYVNFSENEMPTGSMVPSDPTEASAEALKIDLFSQFPPKSSADKSRFVSDALGLDVDELSSKHQVRSYLLKEYLRHAPSILINISKTLRRRFKKSRLRHSIRRMRQRVKKLF